MRLAGDVFECGVYKGGTAKLLEDTMKRVGSSKNLHLFDTFEGMPQTDAKKDWHKKGDFADTSLEAVQTLIGDNECVWYHKGFIPDTFAPLQDIESICFAHVDVDIYRSVVDCCAFIWPRLSVGGAMVFDDYGFDTCKGALDAVNDFFAQTNAFPICLPTGQAIVYKA
jgi:O-methyltransferase